MVKTKHHSIDPAETTLSHLDRIREDICETVKLSECVQCFHKWSINTGCIEIQWIIPEEYDYDLISIFCAEAGKKLLERHQIEKIYINNVLIDNSVRNNTEHSHIILFPISLIIAITPNCCILRDLGEG